MNRRHLNKTIVSKPMLVLVAALIALNASQGIVLCVDSDGHMSIRPAGHHYCLTESHEHEHGHEHVEPCVYEDAASETDHEHCETCVDIPVSAEDRLSFKTAQPLIVATIGDAAAGFPADRQPHLGTLHRSLPTSCLPLRTVILQV